MKQKSNLLMIVALLIVLSGFLVAGKPITVAAKKSAKEYVNKLKSSVQLTDSQSLVIEKYAAEYFSANMVVNSNNDTKSKDIQKKELYTTFKMHIDSLFTPIQKEQYKTNIEIKKQNHLKKSSSQN